MNPARFLGRESELGTVQAGRAADLVVLDANPLLNIANTRRIASVVYRGQLLPRSALDQMLAHAEAFAGRKPIGDVLFSTIQQQGAEAAVKQYHELQATQPRTYDFGESELIGLGYGLIQLKKYADAIVIFHLGVEAFPRSYNTYDSLAEAYMDNGDKEAAITNYRKSLELNPHNLNAREKLKRLGAH